MNRRWAIPGFSSARRSSSIGSSTSRFCSGESASGAQYSHASFAYSRSWSYETLISIIRTMPAGSRPASRAPSSIAALSSS